MPPVSVAQEALQQPVLLLFDHQSPANASVVERLTQI
ncbi:hypothetical protein PVAP13_1KG127054 [Panicum virgatum]|uniref:Uncharacterized protein n=1 Tax=Panicum virgatum TaxID=38727 RepID=A0A8T0XHV4_PANVG|nr:hypothetical protein PVAP13_1KG127054 [Panicum virgatum]